MEAKRVKQVEEVKEEEAKETKKQHNLARFRAVQAEINKIKPRNKKYDGLLKRLATGEDPSSEDEGVIIGDFFPGKLRYSKEDDQEDDEEESDEEEESD